MLARAAFAVLLLLSADGSHGGDLLVTATSDSVDGDVSSVEALIANPGADGLSIREAILAAAHTNGSHRIRFSSALDGLTIALIEPLYLRANRTELIGNQDAAGHPSVTIDGTAISTPTCCRALLFVLASSCRISRLRFTGVFNHADGAEGSYGQVPARISIHTFTTCSSTRTNSMAAAASRALCRRPFGSGTAPPRPASGWSASPLSGT